jgi:hypothetical protein
MAVVNSILTKVDMSTEKYKKKLQGMKKDTKAATAGIKESFKALATSWGSIVTAIGTGAFVNAIKNSRVELENAVASLSGISGGIAEANTMFDLLQQSARDCIEPFDSLQAAALSIGKYGITPTAENLKALKQIALATGQQMTTAANAFGQVTMGKYEGLEQLGIKALDTGNKLQLTYKGVTQEIDKNTTALENYIIKLGASNSQALDYLQGGMVGALNKLDNAWGDLIREFAASPLGDIITDAVNAIADALDALTAYIHNSDAFSYLAVQASDTFKEIIDGFKWLADSAKDVNENMTENFGLSFGDIAGAFGAMLIKFKVAMMAFVTLIGTFIESLVDVFKNSFKACKDYVTSLFNLDFTGAYNSFTKGFTDIPKIISDKLEVAGRAIDMYEKDSFKKQELHLKEYKQKMEASHKGIVKSGERTFGKLTTASAKHVKSVKDQTDQMLAQWQSFYASLQSTHDDLTLSDAQKLDQKYADELAKLEEFHSAALISEEQYQNALMLLKANKAIEIEQHKNEALEKYQEQSKAQAGKVNSLGINEDDFDHMRNGLDDLGDAFANLGESMSKSSSSYKAVFAMQKAFSVASATLNCISAWAKALGTSTTWYESLANYASAIAMTTSIMSQIKQVNMYDKGGKIPSGKLGIVGEYGPEIIQGPANVTSRKDTAEMLNKNGYTNITVNVVEDSGKAGNVETKETDEETIINVFVSNVRKGGEASQALQSTFGLKRVGM